VAVEAEELAAVDSRCPSKSNSSRKLPHLAAVDLHHLHDLPSPLGERFIHHRAAGAAAPPKLGRRRRGLCEPLDL
jgi:hypothetical protein